MSQRVWLSIQFDCRGDGAERHLDSLGANFVFVGSSAAAAHMVGVGNQNCLGLAGGNVSKVIVCCREICVQPFLPFLPKSPPCCGSRRHDAILDGFSRSSEQVFDMIDVLNWNRFQKLFCGGGNLLENLVRNVAGLVECSREAISAMTL